MIDVEKLQNDLLLFESENKELRAALTDLTTAYLKLSQACGDGIDALNNHAKIVMSLGVDLNAKG